jgi:hypothetical protein
MKQETRYYYQKKIKELEKDRDALSSFREALRIVHDHLDSAVAEGKTQVHAVYLIRAIRRVWK